MGIFAGIRWRGGVKWEWGVKKWRFSLLSLAVSSEPSHLRPRPNMQQVACCIDKKSRLSTCCTKLNMFNFFATCCMLSRLVACLDALSTNCRQFINIHQPRDSQQRELKMAEDVCNRRVEWPRTPKLNYLSSFWRKMSVYGRQLPIPGSRDPGGIMGSRRCDMKNRYFWIYGLRPILLNLHFLLQRHRPIQIGQCCKVT